MIWTCSVVHPPCFCSTGYLSLPLYILPRNTFLYRRNITDSYSTRTFQKLYWLSMVNQSAMSFLMVQSEVFTVLYQLYCIEKLPKQESKGLFAVGFATVVASVVGQSCGANFSRLVLLQLLCEQQRGWGCLDTPEEPIQHSQRCVHRASPHHCLAHPRDIQVNWCSWCQDGSSTALPHLAN